MELLETGWSGRFGLRFAWGAPEVPIGAMWRLSMLGRQGRVAGLAAYAI